MDPGAVWAFVLLQRCALQSSHTNGDLFLPVSLHGAVIGRRGDVQYMSDSRVSKPIPVPHSCRELPFRFANHGWPK